MLVDGHIARYVESSKEIAVKEKLRLRHVTEAFLTFRCSIWSPYRYQQPLRMLRGATRGGPIGKVAGNITLARPEVPASAADTHSGVEVGVDEGGR